MSSRGTTAAAPTLVPPAAKTAHNILWLVAERGFKAVGGVAIGVLIARHLGPEDYGRYGAAIGLATLAKEAVILGFDRLIRRDLTIAPTRAGQIIGTSISLGLTLAFVVALLLTALTGHIVADEETRRLTLVLVWMALPQAFFACEVWFESAGQTKPLVWTRNLVWLASLFGRIALVLTNAPVLAFAVLALVEWIVTYGAVCALLRHLHRHELHFSFDGAQLKAWFQEGRPVMLMAVLNSSADRLMTTLAQNMSADAAEAGYLSAALRISDVWWSISTVIGAVLLPRIVRQQLSSSDRSTVAMQSYADASLFIGVVAALGATFTAPWVIPLLFGQAYAPSALVLVILFWSGPAVFSAVSRAQFLVSRGLLKLELPSVAAIGTLQLFLATLLVPRLGAAGAALAITGGNWLGFYGTALAIPRLRRASRPQFSAFRSLLAPSGVLRSLAGFAGQMFGKH